MSWPFLEAVAFQSLMSMTGSLLYLVYRATELRKTWSRQLQIPGAMRLAKLETTDRLTLAKPSCPLRDMMLGPRAVGCKF